MADNAAPGARLGFNLPNRRGRGMLAVMQAGRWSVGRGIVAGTMVLALSLSTAARTLAQQADDGGPASADDPLPTAPPSWVQSATGPRLACGTRPTSRTTDGPSSATLTCWIAGAPEGDTSFSAQALRVVDQAGTTRPIGPSFATGTIVDGSGVGSGVIQDVLPLMVGVMVQATLQPSGTVVGPIRLLPTQVGT